MTVQRYLARGAKFDAKVLAELHRALLDIAEQYSVDLTKSVWGKEIIAAAAKGANSVPGAVFTLSKDQINTALWNSRIKINNLLDGGAETLREIVAAAHFRGDSLSKISKAVQETVKTPGRVLDAVDADRIARNEVFSIYRQTSRAAADAEGITLFQMLGPVDSRTSKICLDHVGEVHTEAGWLKIHKYTFEYGLHVNCRHSFDPVRSEASPVVERYRKLAEKQVKAAA
jgi:hypothetical protein